MSNKGEWESGFKRPEHKEFHALALKFRGQFHGPFIEHLSISEENFYAMMRYHGLARAGWLAHFIIDRHGGTPDLPAWVRQSAEYYQQALERADKAEAEVARLQRIETESLRMLAALVYANGGELRVTCEAALKAPRLILSRDDERDAIVFRARLKATP